MKAVLSVSIVSDVFMQICTEISIKPYSYALRIIDSGANTSKCTLHNPL